MEPHYSRNERAILDVDLTVVSDLQQRAIVLTDFLREATVRQDGVCGHLLMRID